MDTFIMRLRFRPRLRRGFLMLFLREEKVCIHNHPPPLSQPHRK
jgi:hypothetical protein